MTTIAPATTPAAETTGTTSTADAVTTNAAGTIEVHDTVELHDTAQNVAVTERPQQPGQATHEAPVAAPTQSHEHPVDQHTAKSFSIASFIIGLVSIVAGWSLIAPIVGLVLGVIALRRKTAERTLALWGVWLNAALLVLGTLTLIAVFAFFGFGMLLAAA